MKRKPIIPQLVRKPNRLRALYIISRRKLGKMTDEKIIVILSAAVFLLQLFIILTAVAAPMHASAQGSVKQVPGKPLGLQAGDTRVNYTVGQAGLNGLQIGQEMPDVTISNIINYKTPTAKISDFKGKLLILDFWSTWCKGCLESFENASGLKKQFGEQLQILFITSQSRAEISKFLTKNPRISGFKPLIATDDNELKKIFPYTTVPHLVWINGDGKLIQITSAYDFTAQNVTAVLQKQPVNFKAPKADITDFDYRKPLFDAGNGGPAIYQYRSMISAFRPGLPGHLGVLKDSSKIRMYAINQSVLTMYKRALQLPLYWPASRIVFEKLDRNQFEIANWFEERQSKAFCYELILPVAREQELNMVMQQDLARYFRLYGEVEQRSVRCYSLTVTDEKLKPKATSGTRESNLQKDKEVKFLKNDWLSSLTEHLNQEPGMPPVFDETGITYKVSMDLGQDVTNIAALNKAISKYGLQLRPQQRTISMLVFSPAPSTNSSNALNQ